MRGKLYRFIFVESRFEPTFMIFFAIVLISGLQIAGAFYLNGQIRRAEARKSLIQRISMMEGILYPERARPTMTNPQNTEPLKLGDTVYVLRGIQQLNGKPAALINNGIYQENDEIAGYRIAKISVSSVLFKHVQTGETRVLFLEN